ncbi:AAA family ATPase [Gulosibacter chungangensis]|uniref:ATP-dependent Clp protease ATP-binding subunit n=1 Tax=Gulosibacter chungangensis TaxID=979746 RepID=A0A7J5B792_9MICO|nr:AAA family ATPase [Gulosibacter chungangensis]KAB1640687.1 ATP-dependent Clp protease ATP-binding subunit [Gulosibacter chungangensis]
MGSDTKVTVYYGPLSWFEKQLGKGARRYLLDALNERDEARRRIRHTVDGQESTEEETPAPRPDRLIAMSSDYASVHEHAITNFVGLVREINPKQLLLHNPPELIHTQLDRVFKTKVESFTYPVVTRDTLIKFRDGFADHLVGQKKVRERMLAALYPLTTDRRSKPVVLMFYGPSGVGKTETAQFINGLLGGKLLRKQFSMFHSDKFASYVFGGTHSESSFARDLLDRSSGVILIDEFDKANSVFHSAFYEVFDEGVFEDKNYRVKLGPALIICTSNYGSEDEIRQALGDALYSRFDALIPFEPLSLDEIKQVIDRLVDGRFEALSPHERAALNSDEIKSLLHVRASSTGNVRKLGKLVDEVISLLLVRAMLDERPEPTVATVPDDEETAA